MSTSAPIYDIVVFGATGYTGTYCAEHVTTGTPTSLAWAVAGRSASKLRNLVDQLKPLNPDRKQPGIEECALDEAELGELAKKTKVLVNCVGPYSLYGEVVLKACVEAGTHYVDTTGEVPWVRRMIGKYHERARETGAVVIPQCGFESAASDLLTHHTVSTLSAPASHVTATVHSVTGSVSGGTLSTIFTIFDTFSASELVASMAPFALSPIRSSAASPPRSLLSRLTSTHRDPALGSLTTWPMGGANAAIVLRTWGLLREREAADDYGPSFTYSEYATVPNRAVGILANLALGGLALLLALPPVRWAARRLATQAGSGPSRESVEKRGERFEFRAVAEADDGSGRRVMGRMAWKGGVYHVTAVFLVEAAVILAGMGREDGGLEGGVLTPAMLGRDFGERMRGAGMLLEAEEI